MQVVLYNGNANTAPPMMNHAPFYFPHVKSIRETLDKGFIMTGICGSAEGDYELMLLKTDSLGMILSTGTEDIMLPAERHELINVVPNPFQNYTTLSSNELTEDATLQVYDMNGLLMKVAYTIVENKIQLDCSGLPAGLYFATIFAHNSSRFTTKIIILE